MLRISEDPTSHDLQFPSASFDMAGPAAFKYAIRCIDECFEQHQECQNRIIPELPTRVVDVGTCESTSSARLHVSHAREVGYYAALSYCWGSQMQVMTTKSTIGKWQQVLPTEALSQTIQDAIKVTRELGMRYLWVDALCIIQDDHADKATEINRMGSIYKNATVTIVAEYPESSHQGFLHERRTLNHGKYFDFLLPDGDMAQIQLHQKAEENRYDGWYLSERAWALQESVLSPRLLIYGKGDIRWQCQSENLKAVYPSPITYSVSSTRLPVNIFGPPPTKSKIDAAQQSEQNKIWDSIVTKYSERFLTIPEDRLPGLAGLASELEIYWQDTFLAGMWKRNLMQRLAWAPVVGGTAQKTSEYVAPSWSWVSANTPIEFEAGYINVLDAKLIDCVVEPDHEKALGRVRSGRLVLDACIRSTEGVSEGPFSWPGWLKLMSNVSREMPDGGGMCVFEAWASSCEE